MGLISCRAVSVGVQLLVWVQMWWYRRYCCQ